MSTRQDNDAVVVQTRLEEVARKVLGTFDEAQALFRYMGGRGIGFNGNANPDGEATPIPADTGTDALVDALRGISTAVEAGYGVLCRETKTGGV